MDRSDVIKLVNEVYTTNAQGVQEVTTTEREVFCQVRSVSRSEFFEGGRNGLNPEFQFTMFFGDYFGERTVLYHGRPYAVYRVYQGRNDTLELYVERKGGTNAITSACSNTVGNARVGYARTQ